MNFSALKEHLMSAAAAAALLGGGAAIITDKVAIAVHEQRIGNLETLNENVEGLRSDIADLRVELAKDGRNDSRN